MCFAEDVKCLEKLTGNFDMKRGQRVQLTASGIRKGCQGRHNIRTGKVLRSFSDASGKPFIRVLRDGLKTVETYALKFWEPEAKPAPRR